MHDENDAAASPPVPDECRDDARRQCTVCDTRIDTTEWYPIRGRSNPDGEFRVYAFCSDACHDTWARGEPADGN